MPRLAPPPPSAVLLLASTQALASLPLLRTAPNRLLSGQGQDLFQVLAAAGAWWTVGAIVLAATGLALLLALWQQRPRAAVFTLAWVAALVWGLTALSGHYASGQGQSSEGLARTSVSAGFWLGLLTAWLLAQDSGRRLQARPWQLALYWGVLLAGLALFLANGALDALSSIKEYNNRQEDFWRSLAQHLRIIALTTGLTVATGLPLGVAMHRRPQWAARVFPLLSLVQTVPSIALFGLLMALLAWLGTLLPLLPAWGIQGIGLAPAVLALTFYSLLPLVRSTYEGLSNLPAALTESGRAMGLSASQLLWQVELPLAAPVILSGLKVMLVQTIGLAAVAALIGAGGLGTLMFEGLFSSALDLVILAVVPIVVLAWLAEALFLALSTLSHRWIRS